MKMTLLEMVQDIMNDMDGDEVNSINDTIESQQVAQIVKTCYAEIMANRNWPHMGKAFRCTGSGDASEPTKLTLPEDIKELRWIKYNKRSSTDTRDKYEKLVWREPEDFYEYCSARASSASNVQIVYVDEIRLNIRNDAPPEFWTSFDDNTIICDSFDSDVDDALQSGKTACWGIRNPSWTHTDSAIPELPSDAFPMLLHEAKSTAQYKLRQVTSEKDEQKAQRQQRWLSRKAWRTRGGIRYPNYGRKANQYRKSQFDKDQASA